MSENQNPPNPPSNGKSKILSTRDRRRLNEELFRLMYNNGLLKFDDALATACARLLIPVADAILTVEACGLETGGEA